MEEGGEPPEGMVSWQVPEQRYAVFNFDFSELNEVFQYVYQTWLPASGYKKAAGPEFELYPPEFAPALGRTDMELWLPIE